MFGLLFPPTIISFNCKKYTYMYCMYAQVLNQPILEFNIHIVHRNGKNKPQSFTYYPSSKLITLWTFETISLEKVNGRLGEPHSCRSEKTLRGILHAALTGTFNTASCTHFRPLLTLSNRLVSICLHHKMFVLRDVYFWVFVLFFFPVTLLSEMHFN